MGECSCRPKEGGRSASGGVAVKQGGTRIAAEKIRDDFAESTRVETLVDVGDGSMHILLARRHAASHIPAEPPRAQSSGTSSHLRTQSVSLADSPPSPPGLQPPTTEKNVRIDRWRPGEVLAGQDRASGAHLAMVERESGRLVQFCRKRYCAALEPLVRIDFCITVFPWKK